MYKAWRHVVLCRVRDSITLPKMCNPSDLEPVCIYRSMTTAVVDCLRALPSPNVRLLETLQWHLHDPKALVTHRIFMITKFLLNEVSPT